MVNRKARKRIAEETLEILERGGYDLDGARIDIHDSLDAARTNSRVYSPEDLDAILAPSPAAGANAFDTRISVRNATTFAAARELTEAGHPHPFCLNFASAKNPGGGFLGGSQAQEESLARGSGLYACIEPQSDYYETNRNHHSSLYTHYMIYSPRVPVFRDDADRLLAEPYEASILTAPAVNAGAVKQNQPQQVPQIAATMRDRIERVLAVALHHAHKDLILGAWGCGVFRNDPRDVAEWFGDFLQNDPRFTNAFRQIVFAVLDHSDELATFRAFAERFPSQPDL